MSGVAPLYAARLARRELRGGARGFGIFLGCLVLGVAAIAGIGSLAAAVTAGIRADARDLLGGDAEATVAYHEASAAERAFLAGSGALSEVATLRAMARSPDGGRRSLIELKAVDRDYPLYGAIALAPSGDLAAALAPRGGTFGAVVDPALLARLGAKLGDTVRIGEAAVQLRAAIRREPDAALGGMIFGPRVIVSRAALARTGLVQPGALITYRYRLRFNPGTDAAAWAARARRAFPEAGWRIRTFADASPGLRRVLERVSMYLSLVGLTALLVGGVGIGNAVRGYIAAKTGTIAAMKCLGAPNRLVFATYLLQVLVLAGAGIAAGLALGGLAPVAAAPLLDRVLPVAARVGIYPAPLALAALYGVLTVLAFSLPPLAGVGAVSPAALFREAAAPRPGRLPLAALATTAGFGIALAALAVAAAQDRRVALWFVAGAIAAFALFRGAGALVVLVAAHLRRPRRPALRLGIANLHRPGAPTVQAMLALGIGLSVLVAIALVEGNLAREIDDRLPEAAPAFFFIDIQPDQLPGFAGVVHSLPGARFEQVPMLRGRITRLNGVAVEDARVAPEAQWAIRSDRGVTYASAVPQGSSVVAGRWWPADYAGPPLVSFDAELARGMGLQVGDTLTVNILGRDITARIANLRRIDWERLGINFVLVFAPGLLEHAPQTRLAAVWLPRGEEDAVVRAATERFPNISAIHVRDALAAVGRVVGMIGNAVRLTAAVTLLAGALVLGGAVAAGHRRRVYDAVVLKVLGATRPAIAAAFLVEYGLVGLLSAAAAGVVGTLAAYCLVSRLMRIEWVFLPGAVFGTAGLALLLTLSLGFLGTWRALGAKAAPHLRNE